MQWSNGLLLGNTNMPDHKDQHQNYIDVDQKTHLMAKQCKAGRALLGWSQRDLASAARVHYRTVLDFENRTRRPIDATLSAMRRAMEEAGVVFIPANGGGEGVRLREPDSEGDLKLTRVSTS